MSKNVLLLRIDKKSQDKNIRKCLLLLALITTGPGSLVVKAPASGAGG